MYRLDGSEYVCFLQREREREGGERERREREVFTINKASCTQTSISDRP
jgi:hypothetical protein